MSTSTPWQYTDASQRVVFYVDGSGAMHSAPVSAPEIQAWVEAGNTIAAAPAQSLAQQAEALLAAGCQISSSGTPALDGTYAADPASQAHVTAEVTSILLNGTFADGSSSIAWLDASGAAHSFTVAQFKAFATSVAAFVSGCLKAMNGQATSLPTQPSAIP